MKPRRVFPSLVGSALAIAVSMPVVLFAQPAAPGTPGTREAAARSKAPVTVNFVNADVDAVARAFAAMIGRQIALDPRVKGNITVYSEQPISVRDAYLLFLSSLRSLGFAMVESSGLLKIVPEADAKLRTGTVAIGETGVRGDQVLTQIFPLRYENPNNLVAVLRPLITANNTINANPGSQALVITDYASNLQRLGKIIAALDQPSSSGTQVVPLKHGIASDLAPLVQRLTQTGPVAATPNAAVAGAVTVLAEPRGNSLIVRAPSDAKLAEVLNLISQLDTPSADGAAGGPAGGIWVVHLKNADATNLATVLRAAFSGGTGGTGGPGGPGGGGTATPTTPTPTRTTPTTTTTGTSLGGDANTPGTAPLSASAGPSTGGFIQADPATNSLIISAPEPLYRQVRTMIDQLDSRRAQIYIESMIVEVSGGDTADFGFQWQGLIGRRGNDYIGGIGTNFSGGPGGNIIDLTVGLQDPASLTSSAVGDGFNIGLVRNYGGAYALTAIARMLQSKATTNIVSTPNLITLDNEEAKIVVGENVPFITGQFTTTGTAATNPFQTIERKDVGITLRIKPQIGESGTVRLQIYQEQSSVKTDTAAGTSNAGPSTTKRSIESTVVVDDGQIIVLGGLIEDRFVDNKSKVPLLGDIPYLGALFRSENRERRRSNLMVFLRPMVMRNAEAARDISLDRYEQIRSEQKDAQPQPSVVMPINEAPVVPPQRAPQAPTAPPPLAPPVPPTPETPSAPPPPAAPLPPPPAAPPPPPPPPAAPQPAPPPAQPDYIGPMIGPGTDR